MMVHKCNECVPLYSRSILLLDNWHLIEFCRLSLWDKVRRGALLLRFQDKAINLGKYTMSEFVEHKDFFMFECQRCSGISVDYIHKEGCPHYTCHCCKRKVYLDITLGDMVVDFWRFCKELIKSEFSSRD